MRIYVLDGGGPKDSENTLNLFLTKCGEKVFWQIGTDMKIKVLYLSLWVLFRFMTNISYKGWLRGWLHEQNLFTKNCSWAISG